MARQASSPSGDNGFEVVGLVEPRIVVVPATVCNAIAEAARSHPVSVAALNVFFEVAQISGEGWRLDISARLVGPPEE